MASGILGTADLAATTWTAVYTVPAAKTAACNVSICNTNATAAAIRLAVSSGASAPSAGEYLEYGFNLPGTGGIDNAFERTGLVLEAGKKVYAYSDTANVSVVVTGYEE